MEEKENKLELLYKYTSLETIANIYVMYVTALYRFFLLVLLFFSIFALFNIGISGLLIALSGYVILTLMFGLIAIFIQMHKNLKKLAENNIYGSN